MNKKLQKHVKRYGSLGYKIFPCNMLKHPVAGYGIHTATDDYYILVNQFRSNDMIGLPTGDINGIVVIDIDNNDGISINEKKLDIIKNLGELPETFEVKTQNGGRHLYYKIAKKIDFRSTRKRVNDSLVIDILAGGSYVLAPSGYGKYTSCNWVDDVIHRDRFMELPDWVLKL